MVKFENNEKVSAGNWTHATVSRQSAKRSRSTTLHHSSQVSRQSISGSGYIHESNLLSRKNPSTRFGAVMLILKLTWLVLGTTDAFSLKTIPAGIRRVSPRSRENAQTTMFSSVVAPVSRSGRRQIAEDIETIEEYVKRNKQRKNSSSTSKPKATRKQRKYTSSTMPGYSETRYDRSNDVPTDEDGKAGLGATNKRRSTTSRNETAYQKRQRQSMEALYRKTSVVPDSLIQFVSEIHQESRLSASDETVLAERIQEVVRIKNIQEDLTEQLDREPTDEELAYACGFRNSVSSLNKALEVGTEAKNKLIRANLRMVQRVVNLYIRNGLGSEYNAGDLMQEGVVALIRAAEKFDPKRGFRFSTYAMYWIRASVKRSQIIQSSPISKPQRLYENHKKIQRNLVDLEATLGRKPTQKELEDATGLSTSQVERSTMAMEQECYSLDAEITNGLKPGAISSGKKMYDIVEAKQDDDQLFEIERLFMREDLISAIRKHLSPLELNLLLLRYGLMEDRTLPGGLSGPLTFAEVSRLAGLKPNKVRRMINGSLERLKHLIAHEWEPEAL